jgi:hypothetical protein
MRRTHLFLGLIVAVAVSSFVVWRTTSGAPQAPEPEPAGVERPAGKTLPLGQVILFNSGVGYFQREGAIDGEARVDLQFPAADVNDLLKSLVLQDTGGGKVTAVSYESQEPVEKTLKSFSLDLTGNPTFGQLLNQARGEKVELTLQNASGLASGTLTGTIVGMESQIEAGMREVHQLNLMCAEGMRCVLLSQVQRVRFLNAQLDSEFRRALEVLAGAHNSQKKSVSLYFAGRGKRTVKVGYVVEAPMWKTSYRLVFDKSGKTSLQGWAVVENTSDEDWKDVRMALVSSRPISFQMDLYQPLFVPRPVVEPDRFASLRPPTYEGPLANNAGNLGVGGGIAGMGGLGLTGMAGANQLGVQGGGQLGQLGNLGVGGGQLGQFGNLGGQFGQFGGQVNRYQNGVPGGQAVTPNRLTYEQLQERRKERDKAREEAKKTGSAIADFDPSASVEAAALAETVGDQVKYVIDHKVSLTRQRSALLPLVNEEASGRRVSIFNEKVHAKFPLRGLKFKNSTGQSLMAGPVSVFEGGSYGGDARLPDLQPGEERLLSFAIDQAVEVKAESRTTPDELTAVRIVKGVVEESHRLRRTKTYLIRNRSAQERTLIVEHPIDADWRLTGNEKAAERSRDFYRFEWKVPAGQSAAREVVEERTLRSTTLVGALAGTKTALFLRSDVVSPKLKEALRQAAAHTGRLTDSRRELAELEERLKAITDDQARLRANLDKLPATSAAHKRYLEKFDKQETQIEALQAKIEEKKAEEKQRQKELEQFLAGLTVE